MCRTLPKTRASSWFRITLPVCDRWTCVCIYKKDSEPVFLSICKQSACSQNLCLNWHNFVGNKCFVSRSMLVIMSLTLHFLKLMEEWLLTSLMQNEGLNMFCRAQLIHNKIYSDVEGMSTLHAEQRIPESVWEPLCCAQACSVNLP